jgi:hypothetical protein
MKKRYCLIRRSCRGGTFYSHDLQTGKRESLETKDQTEAETLINAWNEAQRQPFINLQIAKAYLCAMDEKLIRRTWAEVFDAIIGLRQGATQTRWKTAKNDKSFKPILDKPLIETTAADFLAVLSRPDKILGKPIQSLPHAAKPSANPEAHANRVHQPPKRRPKPDGIGSRVASMPSLPRLTRIPLSASSQPLGSPQVSSSRSSLQ